MQVLDIKENERILIVAPHPDDECIGAGGVLLKYGKNCRVIVLTDGAIGQGKNSKDEERRTRHQEFEDEMKYLGIKDYLFLDIPDGKLINSTDCLINQDLSAFDYIFVTSDKDGHPDHSGAYEAVKRALLKIDDSERPRVFLYEVHKQLESPTGGIDVTDCIQEKKRLISFHKSQTDVLPYDEMAEYNAGYRALQNRMPGRFIEVYQEADVSDAATDTQLRNVEIKLHKQVQFYQILVKWLEHRIDGKSLADAVNSRGYGTVAIYGFAELGKLLIRELSDSKIDVLYALDKDLSKANGADIKVVAPSADLDKPEAVIVTAEFYFAEISSELISLGFKNVFSISDVVDWIK